MPLPFLPLLLPPLLRPLRFLTHTLFFLETQRILLRFIRRPPRNHLESLENAILAHPSHCPTHHYVPDNDGNVIHITEWGTSSKVCVLLHGHSMSSAFWYRNIDHLIQQDFRIIAIDLLGWGRSSRPPCTASTPSQTLAWYHASLLSILTHFKLSNVLLIGHSLGAYLALTLSQKLDSHPHHHSLISRLILISPPCATRRIPFSRALFFFLSPQRIIRRAGLLAYILFHYTYPTDPAYSKLRDYTYSLSLQPSPSGDVSVRSLIHLGFGKAFCKRPLVDHLVTQTVPVEIVVGDCDSSMAVEDVYQLFQTMWREGWNCHLSVVPGSDHCPMLERPKQFADIVAAAEKRWALA